MKPFSIEVPPHPETKAERLQNKVAELVRDMENAIAVEVHGSGIGRPDEESVTEEQLAAEEKEVHARFREELAEILDDVSVQAEALALFDTYANGNEMTAVELSAEMQSLLHGSTEQAEETGAHETVSRTELEAASAALPGFLDDMILANQGDRAVMSKWGNAKLAYEQGDTAPLQTVLEEYAAATEDSEQVQVAQGFLRLLAQQRFEAE